MTTIILTIIGVLLAAAATLMIVFYGGNVFGVGRVAADASTLSNAGTNVLMASSLYRADHSSFPAGPTSADILAEFTGTYLNRDPELPEGFSAQYSSTQYTVSGISDEVCDRVNENARLTPTAIGDGKMACFEGTFFAVY